MTEGLDGGYLVPEVFRAEFDDLRRYVSAVASRKADREARREAAREAADARHAAARGRVDPLLVPVLDHHGPVVGDYSTEAYCEGCDAGWGAEDSPEWPCSTWLLIADSTAPVG